MVLITTFIVKVFTYKHEVEDFQCRLQIASIRLTFLKGKSKFLSIEEYKKEYDKIVEYVCENT